MIAEQFNRAAGSGEGTGFKVFSVAGSVHGGNSIGNPGKAYTVNAYTLIQDGAATPVKAQITWSPLLSNPHLLIGAVVVQGPTAAPTQLALLEVFLDGSSPNDSMLAAAGSNAAISSNTYTVPIFYVTPPLWVGSSHTIDVRINDSNSTYTVFSFDLYCFQLGG